MAIDLITGHQGVAHISAEQIAELQRAELGGYGDAKVMRMIDGGVTYAGLTITVAAGYWRVNGYDMQIQEAEEILIDPTAAGMNRIDKVYATILQDIPSGVQRSELRVVQGEESATTPTAPTKPTAPILNTDELLQIEEVCTVTVSDGAMTFTDNTIPYELANPQDITNTQEMIAPIEAGPTASKAYAKGKQLIYNGLLYKVTTAIAQGDTLTVGTNITFSDDVVTQLETLTKNAPKYGTSSSSASTTSKTATTTNGDFNLHTGSVVRVKFTYTNTATTPTLNVDSTGAHAIKAYNTTKPDVYWKAGDVVEFTYDGSNFIMGATEGQISELNASLTQWTDITSQFTFHANKTEAKVIYNPITKRVVLSARIDSCVNGATIVNNLPTEFKPNSSLLIQMYGVTGTYVIGSAYYRQSSTSSTSTLVKNADVCFDGTKILIYLPTAEAAYAVKMTQITWITN